MTYEGEKCVMGYIFDRTLPPALSESIRQFALRCSVQDLQFSRQEAQGLGVNQFWRARYYLPLTRGRYRPYTERELDNIEAPTNPP